MFLTDINQLRTVEWGRSHLWDIRFNDAELHEFHKWFPASNVEEGLFTVADHSFESHAGTFAVPKSKGLETLKITFLDSVKLTVHEWLKHWVKTIIFNNGKYVSRLSDKGVLKKVKLKNVDNKHRNVVFDGEALSRSYLVYPHGAMVFTGDSEGAPLSNTIEFVIVGET